MVTDFYSIWLVGLWLKLIFFETEMEIALATSGLWHMKDLKILRLPISIQCQNSRRIRQCNSISMDDTHLLRWEQHFKLEKNKNKKTGNNKGY